MRLLSFLPPASTTVHVGALAHDGERVVDLTAIGLEDMYAAAARAGQLARIAGHVLHAEGAVAWRVEETRVVAPLPAARAAHLLPEEGGAGRALPVAGAGAREPALRFDDPAPLLGPGDRVTALAGDRWALCLAIVVGREGTAIAAADAARHVAGYAVAARWLGDDALATPVVQLGPWLVTPDELGDRGRDDGRLDLAARVVVGTAEVARGSLAGTPLGTAALVALASARHTLRPGDVLTMPVGAEGGGWLAVPLAAGQQVTFEIERLGRLTARASAGAADRQTVSIGE